MLASNTILSLFCSIHQHELFVQGRPTVCSMMKRNKIKGVKLQRNNFGKSPNASAGSPGGGPKDEDASSGEDEDVEASASCS